MLTIFTIPRAFQGFFDITQRNAIKSWTLLLPKPEIILLGEEEGMAQVAKEFNVRHIPELKKNEFGTPLINDAFEKIQMAAKNEILAYVNSDIILTGNFIKAISLIQGIKEKDFLMAGRRTNLDIKEPVNFEGDWERKIAKRIKKEGKLYSPAGLDYWIFPRGLRFNCPPFLIGRFGFDSWLVYQFRKWGIPVVDATEVISAIHQNHYRPQEKKDFSEIENKRTIKLMGGYSNLATLRDADLILTKEGFKKPSFKRIILSSPALRPLLGLKRWIQFKIL